VLHFTFESALLKLEKSVFAIGLVDETTLGEL